MCFGTCGVVNGCVLRLLSAGSVQKQPPGAVNRALRSCRQGGWPWCRRKIIAACPIGSTALADGVFVGEICDFGRK